jgi:hypothetical protein
LVGKSESEVVVVLKDRGLTIELFGGPIDLKVGETKKGGRKSDTVLVSQDFLRNGCYSLTVRCPHSSEIISVRVHNNDPVNGLKYDQPSFVWTKEKLETMGLLNVKQDWTEKTKTGGLDGRGRGFRMKEGNEIPPSDGEEVLQ